MSGEAQTRRVGSELELGARLGRGSFGEVFEVRRRGGQVLAAKLEKRAGRAPQLKYESRVYAALGHAAGFPKMHAFFTAGEYNVLVMTRLGKNLEELKGGGTMALAPACAAVVQGLRRLQHVHACGFLHRDVKASNFCLGHHAHGPASAATLHLIDFGLCKKYRTRGGAHVPYREDKGMTGTPRFASVNTQIGVAQGRRDDLESLAYLLVYLLKGKLPWQGQRGDKKEKNRRICRIKMHTPVGELCAGLPPEVPRFVRHVRQLAFAEEPPYDLYAKWLVAAGTRGGSRGEPRGRPKRQ